MFPRMACGNSFCFTWHGSCSFSSVTEMSGESLTEGPRMLHFIFLVLAVAAWWAAYSEGMIPTAMTAIGLFFASYALCMAALFRE